MSELFSERYGYVIKQVQFESLDRVTKKFLWEQLFIHFFLELKLALSNSSSAKRTEAEHFLLRVDRHILYRTYFERPDDIQEILNNCENKFFSSDWYFSFDIIEFVVQNSHKIFDSKEAYEDALKNFTERLNHELEKYRAMYRLVSSMIVPITNEAELSTISTALDATQSLKTVDTHIIKALKFLADRSNPDYHNSIKESTLALEAIVCLIARTPNGTLPDAMKLIRKREVMSLNHNLESTIKSLYNWASDEGGIRHPYKGTNSIIDLDDAKFTIVTCCSLVSYLMAKAAKAGINL